MAENFNGDFSNLNNEQNTNTQNNPFGNSNVNTAQPQQSVNSANSGAFGNNSANTANTQNVPQNQGQPTKQAGKGPLTEEEKAYLREISEENYLIKKNSKRYKRSSLTENARYLSKVRRLYSSKISHRYFFFPIIKVTNLRNRAGGDGKGGAALFSAAARRTKRLVISLVLVFAILAVTAVGTLVPLMVINSDPQNTFNRDGFTIVNAAEVEGSIDDYVMGDMLDLPVLIRNNTNVPVEVRFHIELVAEAGSDLAEAIEDGILSLDDLEVIYNYDSLYWEQRSDGNLYYKSTLENSATENVELIKGFAIDLVDGASSTANEWEGYSLRLNFIVEYGEQ